MFHFCKYNLKFLGLGYDIYSPKTYNFGIVSFKLYQCKKCGKLFYKNKNYFKDIFIKLHVYKLKELDCLGYKNINKIIDNK